MNPIFWRSGAFILSSYTAIFGLTLLIGLAWLAYRMRPHPYSNWIDGTLIAITVGLIAGRLGFVWANWDYYSLRLAKIPKLLEGGLSYHPFLFVALVTFLFWFRNRLPTVLGALAPVVAFAHGLGWMACYLDGCGFGATTLLSPLAADLPDEFGVFAVRYQTQLMGMVGVGLYFFGLAILHYRGWRVENGGQFFFLTLLYLGLLHAMIVPFRGDPFPIFFQQRMDLWLNLLLILAGILGFLAFQRPPKGNR